MFFRSEFPEHRAVGSGSDQRAVPLQVSFDGFFKRSERGKPRFDLRLRDAQVDGSLFDVDVDEKYLGWKLPAFSLQPLMDNAVKHNSITRRNPFHISVHTEGDRLVVSNPKVPKLEPEPSTGIGLENLRNRWHLITGRSIEIDDNGRTFTVRMPLQNPTAG